MDGIIRRRHLPHWVVEGKPFFITACLDGSISAVGMERVRQYRAELDARPKPPQFDEKEWARNKDKLVFKLMDDLLDHECQVQHLSDDRQAKIVQDAFLHFADERYTLLAFVVMPSHHHWLFLPDEAWSIREVEELRAKGATPRTPREIISHSIQSYTANMCNRVRGAAGSYWQLETFDHWARDEAEMFRIIEYIENNPVKAGLVERPEDWRWSSARIRAKAGLEPGEPIRKSHVG